MSAATKPPLFFRGLLLVSILVALGSLLAELINPTPRPLLETFQAEAPDPLDRMPDYSQISHIPWRKEAFFSSLVPLVVYENKYIAWQREQLEKAHQALQKGIELAPRDENFLEATFDYYRVDWPASEEDWAKIFKRVVPVPPDLVLMQGAKESAWGTSRFAQQGNNLFGQWCFTEGCGLVPERRTPDMSHEVRLFSTIQASVRSYLRNINTHRAYRDLRNLRQEILAEGKTPSGVDLAPGLIRYSERRQAYVNEIIGLIQSNSRGIDQAMESYHQEISE
ncbi:glucosaminidase domain-containing protein [Marinospirillum sp.]|uniref:glucosaminidase domain-containing protein n=1 Tax=Marinospirillum sp. TaxID=2183934 RepID=UPI002870516C|nr:glucosaminidase domain-containing protein [Marinospirillum sp.]MDR9467163.1 glucosaminidase domain-containing protein [Marinospirillum sp.]